MIFYKKEHVVNLLQSLSREHGFPFDKKKLGLLLSPVDIVDVGEWISQNQPAEWVKEERLNGYECTCCHKIYGVRSNFCPNCFSRMINYSDSRHQEIKKPKGIVVPDKTFYKTMDCNLQGNDGFQYSAPGIFEPDYCNKYNDKNWLYCSDCFSSTVTYGNMNDVDDEIHGLIHPRVCVVKPIGCTLRKSVGKNRNFYRTDRLEVIRELTREEIFALMEKENTPILERLNFDDLPYEMLYSMRRVRTHSYSYRRYVLLRKDLSAEQKRSLLPKYLHHLITEQ